MRSENNNNNRVVKEVDKDKQIKGKHVQFMSQEKKSANVRCENINDTKIGVNVCFPQGRHGGDRRWGEQK